jgi:hypothetical protein
MDHAALAQMCCSEEHAAQQQASQQVYPTTLRRAKHRS